VVAVLDGDDGADDDDTTTIMFAQNFTKTWVC
jgi:hypothetical protein